MPGRPAAFDDRTLTMKGSPDALARAADILGAPTRLAILATLRDAPGPLHINEIARRVGVDASPVRTHLELLLREGLVDEVTEPRSRLRRFTTRLLDARLVLEGVERVRTPPGRTGEPPKEVQRLERKLASLQKQLDGIREKADRVKREMEQAWARAGER